MNDFVSMSLPKDMKLQAAVGLVSMAHANMETTLRYTVKIIARMSVEEALDATDRDTVSSLRGTVLKLARQEGIKGVAYQRLKAIINRSRKASDDRNKLVHRPWAQNDQGQYVTMQENYDWGTPPDKEDLAELTDRITIISGELNHARLHGFLKEALDS